MRNFANALCVVFAIWLVVEPGTNAAAQSSVVSTMPAPGKASPTSTVDSEFPGSPLFDAISFDAFSDVIKALLTEEKSPSRGAREIAIFRRAAPAVVLIKTSEGSGSGIILESGLILTNRHVVEGVGKVQIFFKPTNREKGNTDAEIRTGVVKFVDRQRDLAIIAPDSLPPNSRFLKISPSDVFDVGADVYAIGHPLGYTWTFTQGIISGVRSVDTAEQHYTAIQTQTPINPGNSGGPLLNSDLEVIGINTWAYNFSSIKKEQIAGEDVTVARPAQGLNFAVSAPDLRGFVSDVESGRLSTLALQLPRYRPGCAGQLVFNGRTKSDDAALKQFSLGCDDVADSWEIIPDDKSKPIEYHLDPDRSGKSSIIVFSDPKTGKWLFSLWDLFRDQSFAVIGHHDNGTIQPTRFEYAKT